ncbi:MAG: hypothetical protein M5U12_29360 [Verrucomicrobia bacterium]|nr:hypothetical protein [Verrucomicrobiota bacterium]
MTTLIGTPPNLIVSGFRAATGAGHFGVFDFTPVGLSLALCGVLFITLVGWRLVPVRERAGAESFETGAYLTEARVTKDSKAAGRTLRELGEELEKADAQIVGFVRGEFRLAVPSPARKLRPDDILVIEAEPKSLATVLSQLGLKLVEDVPVPPGQGHPVARRNHRSDAPRDRHRGVQTSPSDHRLRRRGAHGAGGATRDRPDQSLGDRCSAAHPVWDQPAGLVAAR